MRFVIYFCLMFAFAHSMAADATDTAAISQHAESGDALAQAKLASLYLLGRDNTPKNEQQAAVWMEKAAKQGLLDAQVAIAAMYDRGVGVTADRDKSTEWYEKAAAKGNTTALAILGKNDAAKGSVQFNYQAMRLNAAKTIPSEYAKKFLTIK